jgi:hypothetical protein
MGLINFFKRKLGMEVKNKRTLGEVLQWLILNGWIPA